MSKNKNSQNSNITKQTNITKECYSKAFKELQNDLKNVKDKLFCIIQKFLYDYYEVNKTDHDVDFVLFEPTSRIKGLKSFEEKLVRKNYIKTWNIEKTQNGANDLRKTILKNLDDIIGFRINCYFKKDEVAIYADIINYFESNGITVKDYGTEDGKKHNNINEITEKIKKQANKEAIYKIVCVYTESEGNEYPFELQIKSLVHNLWGEVDHEIAYKAKLYDYDYEKKSQIIKAVFDSLKASDTQLVNLYKNKYEEINMIHSLFFLYTHSDVQEKLNGKNPTFYYHKFFNLFNDPESINKIKEYVGKKILNDNSFSTTINSVENQNVDLQEKFLYHLHNYNFYDYDRLTEIKIISEMIYKWETDETFYKFIFIQLYNQIKKSIISEQPNTSTEEYEEDDDTPFMEEALTEKQEINLTDIFKKELVNESKNNIFITISTMRNLEDYDKEVLCKIFYCLLDNF